MQGDDEREGYEEDHADRDDYPEEVWEQMQLEKWQAEHGGDDEPDAPEPDDRERLEKLARDFEEMGPGEGEPQDEPRDEPRAGDLPDPF